MPDTATTVPTVGDKVVYVPAPEHVGLAAAGAWQRRQHNPAQVIDGPRGDDSHYRCWTPGDHDYWTAPPERLRVVERATYTPVKEPAA